MDNLLEAIKGEILDPIVLLLFVLAVAYFFWGLAEFIWKSSDKEGRETGKEHMLWGIIGLFIMASVQGIIAIIEGTFGI
jgi:uncharacterized membrane protein YfcA|tara:strand:+ start:32 stop:268 length:237 start_codon:yes stop_codon:yes gene_type:complete